MYRYAFIIFMALLIQVTSLGGQALRISAVFDTTVIRIGEQTRFSITVDQPAGMYVSLPEFTDTLTADLEILRAGPVDTVRIDRQNLRITRSWRVTSFNPGYHQPAPIAFAFLLDGDERILHARPPALRVLSPEIDNEAGIYDIKAPFSIPLRFRDLLPWILLVAVLILLAWLGYSRLRKRKAVRDLPVFRPAGRVEPAHVIALRELKKLKSESLWQSGMVKEYYTRLTGIIRKYIERRFGITAMERTSREIISELKGRGTLSGEVIGLLEQCFAIADLVKFAKAKPGEEYHELILNTGFRFVKETCGPDPQPGLTTPDSSAPVEAGNDDHEGVDERQNVK
jgi:hypothetical protein